MKKILLYIFCYAITAISFAQKQTFDLITFTPPKGWTTNVEETLVSYTITDNKTKSWCRINVIKSTISKGNIEADFESEWQDLILKNYHPTSDRQVNEVQEAEGWKIQAGKSKFTFENSESMAMLTTASGYDRCLSIVAVTNNKDYIKDIEALLVSVELIRPENVSQKTVVVNDDANSIIGTWGISVVVPYRSGTEGSAGSNVKQYTFNSNGTYTFYIKTFSYSVSKLLLTRETGTYQISGNTITISPQKSVIEAWSKKDGGDKWGSLLSTQNKILEKTTYSFSKHYFSGIQEWNLVLQADKETQRDGPFSNSTTFSKAWLYGIPCSECLIQLPEGMPSQEDKSGTSINGSFKFSTTNFDDGWTSTEQADWVEVKKADIKVLLHYPKDGTVFAADPEPLISAAWNILVAPRYSNLQEFKTTYITAYNRPYLGMGYATENATGKAVFVALFRQGGKQGGGWIEVITPDKNSFIQQFKLDPETIRWDSDAEALAPLAKMKDYNKFAVDNTDFTGKWTSDFTGIQQLYFVNTGDYAGMNMNQSNEEFIFGKNNTYSWKLLVINGMVGNAKFNKVQSFGTFSIPNNWQIHFSKIEAKPVTYNAYWSSLKGARILNLLKADYPGSGIYEQYGLAK